MNKTATNLKLYLLQGYQFTVEILELLKFLVEGKRKKRFLESSAQAEVEELTRRNKKYQYLAYGFYQKTIGKIENHKTLIFIIIVLFIAASYPLGRILPFLNIEECKLNDISEFEKFVATIQATLFAVVIPFSTAIFEFVFKDYRTKIELIRLVHRETGVLFLTVSSIFLTIAITWCEYLHIAHRISPNFGLTLFFLLWFFINTAGMGRFIIVGLQFLTPYYRNYALTKFVANEVYPNELKSYIRRNIYLSLGKLTKEEGQDE